MVAVQIRDVPDDVRQTLAQVAAARGQSLQSFLLQLLRDEARRADNLSLLERFSYQHGGSRLSIPESRAALDDARSDRETRLGS
jgi:uncharacterized protein (DUF1778 family)